jgi:hypothetical protein
MIGVASVSCFVIAEPSTAGTRDVVPRLAGLAAGDRISAAPRGEAGVAMNRRRTRILLGVVLALAALGPGCGRITAWWIAGQWESENTPKRTLILRTDGTYLQRFSGKGLGFVSDILGPETGRWNVEGRNLVLASPRGESDEVIRRLAIDGLTRSSVMLAGEHWDRVR